MNRYKLVIAIAAIFALLGGFAAGPALLEAQDATPEAEVVFGARILEGACDIEGVVAFDLNDVMLAPAGGTPVATPVMMDAMHEIVLSSASIVDMDLNDLIAGDYSLVVYAKDESRAVVACGTIAGEIRLHQRSDAPAGLVIPLRQLDDTNYSGMAWLTATADGQTEVTVFLTTTIGRGPMGGQS